MMLYPENFPVPLLTLAETNSTNHYLKDLCQRKQVEEFTTVVADYQTAGRGQRGNSWESAKGENLLFSFVLQPSFLQARNQFLLSQIVSLSIKEVLERYTKDISIKWPNDIYWKEKKICGMLIENDLTGQYIGRSIAGIGININQKIFSSPAPNPVSLYQITRKEYGILEVLSQVMLKIKEYYTLLKIEKYEVIAKRYREALFRKEGFYPYKDDKEIFEAEIVHVEPDGILVLRDTKGEKRKYTFKEVQFIIDSKP